MRLDAPEKLPSCATAQPGLRAALRVSKLSIDSTCCKRQADVVEAVQQAVLAERIDVELDLAAVGTA